MADACGDKRGEAVKDAHDALQEFDDTVDMTDEASVTAWWKAWGAPALDALDKVRCTPVHGSCNLPAGHAGQHNAFAASHAREKRLPCDFCGVEISPAMLPVHECPQMTSTPSTIAPNALCDELDERIAGIDHVGTGTIKSGQAEEKEWRDLAAKIRSALSATPCIAATAKERAAAWDALPKCQCSGDPSDCHGYYNCKRKRCEGNCVPPGWVHWNCPTHGPGGSDAVRATDGGTQA